MFAYFEWLVIILPLSSAFTNAFLGSRFGRRTQNWVAISGLVGCLFTLIPLVTSQVLRPDLVGHPQSFPWFKVWDGDKFVEGPLALRVDTLSICAASAVSATGLILVAYAVQHLPNAGSRHLILAVLDTVLATTLLAVLADNPMCLLLGWTLSTWCMSEAAWAMPDTFLPLAAVSHRSQTTASRDPHAVARMLTLTSDLSLLFSMGFLASALPSWTLDIAANLTWLTSSGTAVPRDVDAAAIFWLLASLVRLGRMPSHAQVFGGRPRITLVAAYALSSAFPGVYLIVRGLPLVVLALSQHLPGPFLWSDGSATRWWWFGIGSAVAILGYSLACRLSSPTASSAARAARPARPWDLTCSCQHRLRQFLSRAGAPLPTPTVAAWMRRIEGGVASLPRQATPVDDEPPHLTLTFILLGTLLVLAYLLLDRGA